LTCASKALAPAIATWLAIAATTATAQTPQEVLDRAVAHFEAGRVVQSAEEFDRLITIRPAIAPELWQRGIALYYAGRYDDCRRQFELHRTVNPNDVENAAWHFLCVARAESPAAAAKALLPVGPDARVPMQQVLELFRGRMTPEQVLQAAGAQPGAQFYAHLYLGLFADATGDARRAIEHITAAADSRYASAGGYMHTVAKVHLATLKPR
jgi:lipoprotein NlpI